MMKKTVVTIACTLIALLTFAQPGSKSTKTTTETITVTGTVIPSAIEDGAAANYQPAKTLVVREDNANNAGRYVLNGPGHVVNKLGEVVQTAIKPGARVRVYYANMGDNTLPDQIAAMRQIAGRYAYVDLDRAGIYGHSGGGFAAADAMFRQAGWKPHRCPRRTREA